MSAEGVGGRGREEKMKLEEAVKEMNEVTTEEARKGVIKRWGKAGAREGGGRREREGERGGGEEERERGREGGEVVSQKSGSWLWGPRPRSLLPPHQGPQRLSP